MKQYLNILNDVLENGDLRDNRTETPILGRFCNQTRYNLEDGFPLLTTKKIHWKSVVHELLWFLSGSTNIKYLQENNVRIWNEWADENGELGPGTYGVMWRYWPCFKEKNYIGYSSRNGMEIEMEADSVEISYIDQIDNVIDSIKNNPMSRRHIVNAWNPALVDDTTLPPCHTQFQFYVTSDNKLSCHLNQRSADVFLGVPFNVASYALLTEMIAHVSGLKAGEFVHTLVDYHLYVNHIEQAKLQLSRIPKKLPKLKIKRKVENIDDFKFSDFEIVDYFPESGIKAEVAV